MERLGGPRNEWRDIINEKFSVYICYICIAMFNLAFGESLCEEVSHSRLQFFSSDFDLKNE